MARSTDLTAIIFYFTRIPLNPLNFTFYKKLPVPPTKDGNLPYLQCFHFLLSKLSEKAYKRRPGHCDKNVAQVLVIFHI